MSLKKELSLRGPKERATDTVRKNRLVKEANWMMSVPWSHDKNRGWTVECLANERSESAASRYTVERIEAYDTRRVNPKSFRWLNGGKADVGVSFYSRGPISFQEGGDSPAQETRSVRARCQPGPRRQRIERSQKREERHRPDTRRRKITVPFYTFIRNELLQRPTFPRCSGLTVSFDSVPENSNGER